MSDVVAPYGRILNQKRLHVKSLRFEQVQAVVKFYVENFFDISGQEKIEISRKSKILYGIEEAI